MSIDSFSQAKKDVLSRADKSSIGGWDKKVTRLCWKINKNKNYYTTSSCSGRIILMWDRDKKGEGLFVKVWHEEVSFKELKKELEKIKKGEIKFKQEPCIIHIACKSLEDAQKLHDLAKLSGWKRCGIISIKRKIVLEINCTEKLEFPVIHSGKILVDDKFLRIVLEKANKNLEKSLEKIQKLEKMF